MAWRPKNLNDALFPLSTLCALLGYGIFQFPIGKRRVLFSLVYSIIMASLCCSALVYSLKFDYDNSPSLKESIIFVIIIPIHIGIAALGQILSWYHRNTSLRIFKSIMNVDETLRKLGAKFNYTRDMNLGILLIIYWLLMVISLNCITVSGFYGGTLSIVRSGAIFVTIHHPIYLNMLIAFIFSLKVRILETRFYELNELLVGSSESSFQQSQDDRVSNFLGNRNRATNWTLGLQTQRFFRADKNLICLIQTTKHVHLELMNVWSRVDKMYGIQMALEVACFFGTSTVLMYEYYCNVTNPLTNQDHFGTFITIAWSVVIFVNFLIINRCCDRLTAEAKRTSDIIHCIDETSKNLQLSDEIRQFSLQLMHSDLCFSPAGLFTLGYPFVGAFLGAVVTHSVIIIQMS